MANYLLTSLGKLAHMCPVAVRHGKRYRHRKHCTQNLWCSSLDFRGHSSQKDIL